MTARSAAGIMLALLSACAGSAPPPPTRGLTPTPSAASSTLTPTAAAEADAAPPAAPAAAAAIEPAPPAVAVPPPAFPPSATFRDLVAAVRSAAPSHVVGECVLGGAASGPLRLVTYDAVAGLVDPPADLDSLLEKRVAGGFDSPGLRLVAEWGSSEGGDYLDLVALGPVPKTIKSTVVPVILATNKGLYLGVLGMASDGTRLDATTQARVRNELLPKAKVWVVTAEGDAPLARVREALALVKDTKGTVVLASPTPSPGRRGKRASRYDARVPKGEKYACESDLSDVAGIAVGNYKMSTLSSVGDAIDRAARACGETLATGRGGAIHAMVRIAPDGHIEKSCAETDDIGEESVRACVMDAIQKLRFPAPDQKKGVVPFGTSVIFTGKPVRALCEK